MTANRTRRVTPTARTAFRTASAGLTGLATFGAVAATGWVAAIAARDYEHTQAEKAAAAAATARRAAAERTAWLEAHPVVRVVEHRRPHRTIVTLVRRAATAPGSSSSAGSVAPGRGGTITRTPTTVRTSGQSTSSGSGHTTSTHPAAPAPAPAPAPPPPPPPAPSSGS